mmetsp:Transcript_6355/g.7333  ORF Transcript_6355/g.7333 Transcript_6355/m.7333 type:complete len:84 (-) Transcript_6355:164-415(-)
MPTFEHTLNMCTLKLHYLASLSNQSRVYLLLLVLAQLIDTTQCRTDGGNELIGLWPPKDKGRFDFDHIVGRTISADDDTIGKS